MTGLPHYQPGTEHTPTPWMAEANAFGTWFIYREEKTETSPMGFMHRQLVSGGDGYRTLTAENAAFIVEAVNSHAALKSRVEELTKALEDARGYVDRAIASYVGDPADNQFQRGHLAALEVVRDEAFSTGSVVPLDDKGTAA